jgi:hypothetical protein
MQCFSTNTKQIFKLSIKEKERIVALLPRYAFHNKKSGCSLTLNKNQVDGKIEQWEFKFSINEGNTSYKDHSPVSFNFVKTDVDKDDDITLMVNTYSSHTIDSSISHVPSSIAQHVLQYIQMQNQVTPPPTILPPNAIVQWVVDLFGKHFAFIVVPPHGSTKIDPDSPVILVVKYITENTQTKLYQNLDKAPHFVCSTVEVYGDMDGVEDNASFQIIDIEHAGAFGLTMSEKSKIFKTEKCFDLLKKEKLLPIFMLTPDLRTNIQQSIAFTNLILQEIETNKKFTTSSLVLV